MSISHQLRKVASPFVSPDVYDFWIGKLVSNASWETPLATVVEVRNEARDAVSIFLKPNRHFVGFQSGQHINVTVEVDGVRYTRSYSITTTPELLQEKRRIGITVKRYAGGIVSNFLCDTAARGTVIEIGQAFGEMTVPAEDSAPIVLLAAGSGITPLVSIVRELHGRADNTSRSVTLLYWAQTRGDLCFFDELQTLAQNDPGFRLHFILTQEPELLAGEKRGRPNHDLLQELGPDFSQSRVYACGPAGFVESVRDLIGNRAPSFMAESFSPIKPVAVQPNQAGEVLVTLSRSNRTVSVATNVSLLEALEQVGERIVSGCRRGICNTCACAKASGISSNLVNGDESAQPASALRLCVSAARSDMVLDL